MCVYIYDGRRDNETLIFSLKIRKEKGRDTNILFGPRLSLYVHIFYLIFLQ